MTAYVGIYAVDDSTSVWNAEVCLDWRLPDGCPHATQPDRDANHIHVPVDTRGHGKQLTEYIKRAALRQGKAAAAGRVTPQNALVGQYDAVDAVDDDR